MSLRYVAPETEIAIVGMAGRFPGAADLDEFWDLLCAGREGISRFSAEELAAAGIPADVIRDPAYVPVHGILPGVELFDTAFFDLTPAEAELTDPQQRLFLETCHAALENAGYDPSRFPGLISVFGGAAINTYLQQQVLPNVDQTKVSKHFQVMVGNDKDYLATRVSYKLDLKGPSYTVQTACSTSLVAVHLACQGLLNGECDMALAGGVTVKLPQVRGYLHEDGTILSVDGHVRAFDAGASGTVLGNGVGVVVLKLLKDAVADRDAIRAVIKGTAANNDGSLKVSYFAPGKEGQVAVIAEAHTVAGVDPATITYVEAHGTATKLGDSVEIAALSEAFARRTAKKRFCGIGSVKSNIGHLDAAAGIAGMIKTALMLRNRALVPTVSFARSNPDSDLENSPFYVCTELRPWTAEGPLRAGVSSFGIGGTNAHAILEEPPAPTPTGPSRDRQLLLLSARTATALDALTDRLAEHLQERPDLNLADVAYTLAVGRRAYPHRRAVLCRDLAEAVGALRERREPACRTADLGHATAPVAFVFDEGSADAERSVLSPRSDPYEALRDAWLGGAAVDWERYYSRERRGRVPLPTYPFEGRRCWLTGGAATLAPPSKLHPLLDANVSTLDRLRYVTTQTGDEFYIADHVVAGEPVLPAVAYLEMARAAGELAAGTAVGVLRDIAFERALSFARGPRTVQIGLVANGGGIRFEVTAADAGEVLARGQVVPGEPAGPAPCIDVDAVGRRCPAALDGPACYDLVAAHGLRYGPRLRALRRLACGENEGLALLELPEAVADGFTELGLHPALLDGALHAAVALLARGAQSPDLLYQPFSLAELEIRGPLPPRCLAQVTVSPWAGERLRRIDVALCDTEGRVRVRMGQLAVRAVPGAGPALALFDSAWTDAEPADGGWPGGRYLLLADDPALRDELAAAVGGDAVVVLVTTGERFAALDPRRFVVDPTRPDDLSRLLAALADADLFPSAVLHAWCLDASAGVSLGEQLDRGICSLFLLTKALMAWRRAEPLGLLFAYPTGPDGGCPWHAAAAGFARTVRLESPRLSCRVVGIDAGTDAAVTLARELRAGDGPVEARYEGGRRRVRRYRPVEAGEPVALRGDGAYLITGGGGGLGLLVAEHLARSGAGSLVLAGRSALPPAAVERIARIEATGAAVRYVRSDVADEEQARALVAGIRAGHGALRGVIHAAGELRDSYLRNKSLDDLRAVMAPKLRGCVHLDRLTAAEPLDFFALFSSVVGSFGGVGQADYAFANAFLDAFVPYRQAAVAAGRRQGRTVSIAWPFWRDGGMRQDGEAAEALRERLGLTAMPTAAGLAALDTALGRDGCVLVGFGDVGRVTAVLAPPAAPARLAEPARPSGAEAETADAAELTAYAGRLLREVVAAETRLDVREIDLQSPVERYGIDSLVITRLNRALERRFGDLSKTLFFEYGTLGELAAYFVAHHRERLRQLSGAGEQRVQPATVAPRPSPAVGAVGAAAAVDGIAVIGLAGCYPLADDLDQLWENLTQGRDCIREIPRSRWDHARYFNPDPNARGSAYSRWGGFLRAVDEFDPLFFGISPREAELMDPQERLFLQNAWHVVEDAGYRRDDLAQRAVGVFVGVMYGEYQLYGAVDALRGGRSVAGSSFATIANRVSYALSLSGPSLALDTMCSSSLTAIHLACESLRRAESELAIAGGVNLSLHPYKYVFLSQGRYVSADGRCRSFGAGGTGYVPGEGVGAVLLKPLPAAVADGDFIYGVIRGHAVNHGGKTNGYTVPDPQAQADVIARALRQAGIAPAEIGYVEAHGTGTALGDPIEIAGLTRAYGPPAGAACGWPIGSVKSNIGHLESAAGIVGLTKVLLQLRHGQLVPSLHAQELNPNIDFARSPFQVQRELAPWPQRRGADGRALPRRAGLSSFGAGGANAHLVLEEHDNGPVLAARPAAQQRGDAPLAFVLSARDEERLREYAGRLARFVETGYVRLADLAYTLQVGREALARRLAVVTADGAVLARALRSFAAGEDAPEVLRPGSGPPDAAAPPFALVRRWLAGEEPDWASLAAGAGGTDRPRRVPAPHYPFARERYWLPGEEMLPPAALHPLLDANESTVEEVRFRRTLRAEEWLLRDHVIAGRPLLAGAAFLEMVRAAVARAGGQPLCGLRDVAWVRPLAVERDRRDVFVGLRAAGDEVACEVFTEDAQTRTLHMSGRAVYGPAAPAGIGAVDLDALRRQLPLHRTGPEVDAVYRAAGFVYGPSFQVIEELHSGPAGALVRLRLEQASEGLTLHPSLLDGALRACHWAGRSQPPAPEDLTVPFSLGEIVVRAPLPRVCYAYATPAAGPAGSLEPAGIRQLDVALLDEAGGELASVEGFAGRLLHTDDAGGRAEPFFYELTWAVQDAPGSAAGADALLVLADGDEAAALREGLGRWRRVVEARPGTGLAQLLAELARDGVRSLDVAHLWGLSTEPVLPDRDPSDLLAALDAALDRGVYALRELLQAVSAAGIAGRTRCAYVHRETADGFRPDQEAVAGFALSTAAIAPGFELFTVGLAGGGSDRLAEILACELTADGRRAGTEVRYTAGRREVRRLRRAAPPASATVPFKERGVYLLSGGLGRIGRVIAGHLAERYRARLVLVGRSAAAAAEVERLTALGAEVLAEKADVAVPAQAQAALERAKRRFGRLDGVLHLAGVADGRRADEADRERFARVLAPKAHGVLTLDALTRDEPLDVFAVFSSLASVVGDFGACSYAAANRFLDSFAALRDRWVQAGRRHGRTLSLGWPLWAVGGVDALVTADELAGYRRRTGSGSVTPAQGLQAFERAWAYGKPCLVPGFGDVRQVDRALRAVPGHREAPAEAPGVRDRSGAEPVLPRLAGYLRGVLAGVLKVSAAQIDGDSPLDAYGLDSVLVMEANGVLGRDIPGVRSTVLFEHRTVNDLAEHLLREHSETIGRLFGAAPDPAAGAVAAAPALVRPAPAGTAGRDDIAIIGMSGRYPQARDLSQLWENLKQGRDAVTEVPPDRWDASALFDADPDTPGRTYSRWGGFLADVDAFDSLFFQIAPAQARLMDPQERLFLETAWAALEDAGYPPSRLPGLQDGGEGRDVGVFVGVMWDDYAMLGAEESARGNHVVVLANRASLANQVSFFCDFQGPSLVIDTACSASLVALHQACASILRGECACAVAGGVNVSVHPLKYVHLSRKRMLSPDGRCRSFGADGSGYVPGEGVGAVVLKRLSQAIADGDHVHAVIKATAVNHGGRTSGFTVPNPQAQRALVERALAAAGIDPRTLGYVEAHGTGTALGDPIEHTALSQAFAARTGDQGFCALGSVKANLGHLEGAAGIAGVTKAVLQLQHGQIAPALHAEKLNPLIDFARSPFFVPQKLMDWPRPVAAGTGAELPRRTSVSSFGAGGTNAYVLLEEYRAPAVPAAREPELIVLSARSEERLRAYAAALAHFLRTAGAALPLRDVAYTLRIGRKPMCERLAFVAADLDDAADRFGELSRGESGEWLLRGNARQQGALADLFTDGPGGREFLHSQALAGADEALGRLWVSGVALDWDVVHAARPRPRRRVSLPSYPFERARHWLPVHPRTAGTSAPVSRRFTLRAADSSVGDHVVSGRRLLPGVGHLDLVAGALGSVRALTDVRFMAPLAMESETAEVVVVANSDGSYEVRGGDGSAAVYSRGTALLATETEDAEPLALEEVRARCPRSMESAELYRGLRGQGLEYGPFFRCVERLWVGAGEALGRLRLARELAAEAGRYRLHPGLLDAALHTVAGLLDRRGAPPLLPFAVDRVEMLRPVPLAGWSHVRALGAERYDVTVADDTGEVCVRFCGLCYREQKPAAAPLVYVPRWLPMPAGAEPVLAACNLLVVAPDTARELAAAVTRTYAGTAASHLRIGPQGLTDREVDAALARSPQADLVYFLGGIGESAPGDVTALRAGQERTVIALYRLAKGLERAGLLSRPLRLKAVTTGVFPLGEHEDCQPWGAGVVGLCAVLDKEYPHLQVACVDVRACELAAVTRAAIAEPFPAKLEPVSLRAGVRRIRRLERLDLPAEPSRFRRSGAYLVVGGLGVVGRDTSLYLARSYGARLALVGRSPLDARRQADVAGIERAGAEVLYLACDAADPAAMGDVVAQVKRRFGALHGVILSAMALVDRPIRESAEGDLRGPLGAKVDATWSVFQAVRDEPLDFLLLYSSAAAFAGNRGQAGYVAGCCFADAFAAYAARLAPFPVRVVDWGYWHPGGDESRERKLRRLVAAGVQPIGAAEGMAIVEQVVAADVPQAVAVKADPQLLANLGVEPDAAVRARGDRLPSLVEKVGWPALAAPAGRAVHSHQLALLKAERLAQRLLLDAFRRMGVLGSAGERHARAALGVRLGVVPAHQRLLDGLLDILVAAGCLRAEADELVATGEDVDGTDVDGTDADALVAEHPSIAPVVTLLVRCLDSLSAVLTGARSPLEVLFPSGSTELVAAVYQSDEVAGWCNAEVAGLVRLYVEERLRLDPAVRVRVLEVGAGTGSTSARVLPALASYAENVAYAYTDVSTAFVRQGRRRFAADHPFVEFRVLDIEAGLEPQGFQEGGCDVVIAANVLHATRRIRHTLAQVKRLLRRNGLVVVSEGTRVLHQMTMIFGLTSGWWAFEDPEHRLPGSPLLSAASWQDVLAECGFRKVAVRRHPESADGLHQSVLVAESDGMVPVAGPGPAAAAGVPSSAVRPTGDLLAAAERHVAGAFARVLGLAEGQLDRDSTFESYGVDSLVALEITRALERDFGKLPATLLFERITIGQLATYFATERGAALATLASPPRPAAVAAEPPPVPPPETIQPRGGGEDGELARAVDLLSAAEVDELLGHLMTTMAGDRRWAQ
jgi:acyl transferase domain-containing protein/NAD(P)-dependent dehydrogenase (short-subunit alcohol dehydrogenase family)/acyl carrier protein/SAM-dependent methyltransferase/aryl carrier-like protein